jgi:hypothetical protein
MYFDMKSYLKSNRNPTGNHWGHACLLLLEKWKTGCLRLRKLLDFCANLVLIQEIVPNEYGLHMKLVLRHDLKGLTFDYVINHASLVQ